MIESATLLEDPALRHGFFTRKGGVSDGLYRSMNCGFGSGDDPGDVALNRARVATALGLLPHQLVTVHQTHSTDVAVLDGPPEKTVRADALVTARTGLALAVLTADCAPVLLTDHRAGVIGAAHAGWRGALDGVLEATVAAMVGLGARAGHIAAAVGPAIGQANYEVGPEFEERFRAADPANGRFFVPSARAAHHRFDLAGYCARRLERAGLRAVEVLARCTYAESADFYSYRRATHRGESDYGRQISAITLGPAAFDAGPGPSRLRRA
jgi:hypothetical protein